MFATHDQQGTASEDLAHVARILHDIDAIVWETRADTGAITFISPNCERLLGYPADRWHADPRFFASILHPDDREAALAASKAAVVECFPRTIDYRLNSADGRTLWFRGRLNVVVDESGVTCVRGVAVEVTQQREEESWNASSRQILETIARGATIERVLDLIVHAVEQHLPGVACSFLLIDDEGRLRSGPAPSLPLEYRRAVDGVLPGPTVGSCGTAAFLRRRVVVEDIATDPLWAGYRAIALPHGLRSCWSQPVFSAAGAVLGTFAMYTTAPSAPTAREIRVVETVASMAGIGIERARVEDSLRERDEQLRHVQKMEAIGLLAGGIAHDFNNILTAVLGHAEFLRAALSGKLLPHAEGIIASAKRAAGLTRRLLTVSRKQIVEPQTLEMNRIVTDLAEMLRRLIGEDIDLVLQLDPQAGSVRVDRGEIEQVLLNLVVNARDAMPGGGRLTLGSTNIVLDDDFVRRHIGSTAGPHVLLTVTDSGRGMDETTLARAFEPFFTTKESGKGTGLGLSIVYGIVKQARGSVWLSSEPGSGTTVRIYLPVCSAPGQAPEVGLLADAVPAAGGGGTVLIAEDEADVRDLVCEVLSQGGYTVIGARDGAEALALAARHEGPIHLLLTDVVMPSLSGLDLARRLATNRPGLRVLYMSGYPEGAIQDVDHLERSMLFLAKPFSPAALLARVGELLSGEACATR